MRRSIVVIVVCAAIGATSAGLVLRHAAPGRATPAPVYFASGPSSPTEPPRSILTAEQVRSVATAWVSAMWTRPAGRGPFDWLAEVATITSPDLLAELRNARVTLDDQLTVAVTVDIDGIYPDALDPDTVTVTCVAHRRSIVGAVDQPCATTVTVQPGPDDHPIVTAVG
jgi:hypothetical protein